LYLTRNPQLAARWSEAEIPLKAGQRALFTPLNIYPVEFKRFELRVNYSILSLFGEKFL